MRRWRGSGWSSRPATRARRSGRFETAELACQALNVEPEVREVLANGFDADDARELLLEHDADARVLVVGHEPSFSEVVLDLTGGRTDFKKGGVAAVRLQPGELIALLRPRELESLAR